MTEPRTQGAIGALVCSFFLILCAPATAQTPSADLVLHRGKILTVDRSFAVAQAVAVRGERILAVGSNADIDRMIGPGTRVIDLGGRTVVPGLIDSHLHTMVGAVNELAVSFADAKSIKDVQDALAKRAAETPSGKWILGSSFWHESQLAEGRLPTRGEIDAVVPNNPVHIARGGHVVVANTLALKLAGITKETPDPEGGVIVRDKVTGEPTGVLFENPAFMLVRKLIPSFTRDERIKGIKAFSAKLNAVGITSTVEPGLQPDEIAAFMELWRQGGMTTRVHLLRRLNTLADVKSLSMFAPNFGDDWLKLGGFKYLMDGGIEGAHMHDPYRLVEGEQNDPNYVGKMLLPTGGVDELREMLLAAAEGNWQVQVHAVGDATVSTAIDLFEQVNQKYPLRDLRWAIMHIFLPSPAGLEKMKQMGIRATVQDHPTKLGHNMLRYWGQSRAAASIPVRAILDAGIATGGGSDAPVVGWNPFESIWWMVTRKTLTDDAPLGPDQAISREEALRLYTMGSADVEFWEDRLGSIEARKLADLVVLSDDFMSVAADRIRDIKVLTTMAGGKVVYGQLP
jgi:predicted amidohydrolase YtcJ